MAKKETMENLVDYGKKAMVVMGVIFTALLLTPSSTKMKLKNATVKRLSGGN